MNFLNLWIAVPTVLLVMSVCMIIHFHPSVLRNGIDAVVKRIPMRAIKIKTSIIINKVSVHPVLAFAMSTLIALAFLGSVYYRVYYMP